MPRGPAPTPNEKRRATGNPGHKKLPKPSNVVALVPVAQSPEQLGEHGKELWSQLRERAVWIAETDRPTLLLLCEKWDRREELRAALKESSFVLYTEKGYAYPNPIVGMLSTIETEIAKLLASLGLTPADRTRLGVAEVKVQSKLAQLREKSARGANGD